MLGRLAMSLAMMGACVLVHAAGSVAALRRLGRSIPRAARGYWSTTGLLIRVAAWLVSMHLTEIGLWALLYAWGGALPDLQVALYFSSVTYTTVGYGDVVLPDAWRLVGGVEALTGILMCGWSTGAFFSVVSRIGLLRQAVPANAQPTRD